MRYECLYKPDLIYLSHAEHTYQTLTGEDASELLITYETAAKAPEKIMLFRDPFCMVYDAQLLKVRVPIVHDELKLFFENYKDYYYLPTEDMCILKSAAHGVDPAYRVNAKKETCYTKHSGFFIPQFSSDQKGFRKDYNSRICYCPYDPENLSKEYLEQIGTAIVSYLNR
ncbi:MAG: hypothetical protein K5649_06030 [Lachnospiraceae bacterium]|nr:hypothetical protein [Lachnospiraceae bacterium]MCR4685009.1 hypothetical protein [Lachnospiraceae bacterium]